MRIHATWLPAAQVILTSGSEPGDVSLSRHHARGRGRLDDLCGMAGVWGGAGRPRGCGGLEPPDLSSSATSGRQLYVAMHGRIEPEQYFAFVHFSLPLEQLLDLS